MEEFRYRVIREELTDVGFQVNPNGWVSSEVADIQLVNYGQRVDMY